MTNKNNAFITLFPQGRVFLDRRNIRSLEAIYTIKCFNAMVFSTKIKELKDLNYVKSINEFNNYSNIDNLIVHLSPLNIFGGIINKNVTDLLRIILFFNKSIFLLYTDPKILYYNYFQILYDRYFIDKNIKFEDESFIELLNIENINLFENKDYKYLFCGKDYELFKSVLNNDKALWPQKGFNFNLFEIIFANELKDQKLNFYLENKEFDLVYYGNNRGGYRNKILKKLFTFDFNKYLIGYEDNFKNCKFQKYVPVDMLKNELAKCYASIVIGDKAHENNFITARFFENILNGLISFIYLPYDSNKTLYENELLKDILYIESADQVKIVLDEVKKDKVLHREILNLQLKELDRYKKLIL